MDTKTFWKILKKAYISEDEGSDHEWVLALKRELLKLPPDEILLFRQQFDKMVDAAYKTDLWGAAYLINGGCSDDCFHYFRCWLVGMGEKVYQKALANPDSLADVLDGEGRESSLDAAAARAWEEKTGRTDEEFYVELGRLDEETEAIDEGEDWDFDDEEEMQRRLPRLCALYEA